MTNRITDERLERIRQVNLPTLEIDFSRMGGVVSRECLRQLVLHDVAGKEWLHHPGMDLRHAELLRRVEGEIARRELAEDTVSGIFQLTGQEWGQRYLRAVQRHAQLKWAEKPAEDEEHQEQVHQALRAIETAADALSVQGYPTALDSRLFDLGHTILERLLSVRLDTGIGYRFDNAWQVINTMLTDFTDTAKSWHGLYLMAINTYRPAESQGRRLALEGGCKHSSR